MANEADFHNAAKRLLGEKLYNNLLSAGYTVSDLCREIAQYNLIHSLEGVASKEADLVIVRSVATRLWSGDGTTGFRE